MYQPSASGAKRSADAEFTRSRRATGEHQIRDIRACNEQDHPYGAQKNPQRRLEIVTGRLLKQGYDFGRIADEVRIV